MARTGNREEIQLPRIPRTLSMQYLDGEIGTQGDDPYKFWSLAPKSVAGVARAALAHLAIALSSADCERVFSAAGLCCNSLRSSTSPATLHAKLLVSQNSDIFLKT